jgi:hypothetical protein
MYLRYIKGLFVISVIMGTDCRAELELKDTFVKVKDIGNINKPLHDQRVLAPIAHEDRKPFFKFTEPSKVVGAIKNSDKSQISYNQHPHDPFMNEFTRQSKDILSEGLK